MEPSPAPAVNQVLFVGGYNTTPATYEYLFRCLREAGLGVTTTFFYSPSTPTPLVYEQLVARVQAMDKTLAWVVCHSMGGYLTTQLLKHKVLPAECKVVMLQPFIQPSPATPRLRAWMECLYVPFCLCAPLHKLTSAASWKDSYLARAQWRLVSMKQPVYCTTHMCPPEEWGAVFGGRDVRVMVSSDDAITGLSDECVLHLVEQCTRVAVLAAKHEAFNDSADVQSAFREQLLTLCN